MAERHRNSAWATALRTRWRRSRAALACWTLVLVSLLAGRPAAAQSIIQVDGAWNLGYSTATGSGQDGSRLFTDVRPALALQFGSPRLAWRAGYLFAADLTLNGTGANSYSNQLGLSLAAQPTPRSTLALSAGLAQGPTEFQLTQRVPATAQPEFRAPDNPTLVLATLGESFSWEVSPALRLQQDLTGGLSAPQDALGRYNAALSGSLRLDRLFSKDAIGVVLRPSVSLLSPARGEGSHYLSIANSLLGSWNHDFDRSWNGQATAGVQQVLTYTGSYPLALAPTGGLTTRYFAGNAGGSLSYTHAAGSNLQTGTVSISDTVALRGVVSFDPLVPRTLGVSVGYVHARPLGEPAATVAPGTGNAVQGDVRFLWGLGAAVLVTASYSVLHQFGQAGGLPSSRVQVILLGLTARYSNARTAPPMPAPGGRVDGSDAVPFTTGDGRGP